MIELATLMTEEAAPVMREASSIVKVDSFIVKEASSIARVASSTTEEAVFVIEAAMYTLASPDSVPSAANYIVSSPDFVTTLDHLQSKKKAPRCVWHSGDRSLHQLGLPERPCSFVK